MQGQVTFSNFLLLHCFAAAKLDEICMENEQCTLADKWSYCKFVIPRAYGRCQCEPGRERNPATNKCSPFPTSKSWFWWSIRIFSCSFLVSIAVQFCADGCARAQCRDVAANLRYHSLAWMKSNRNLQSLDHKFCIFELRRTPLYEYILRRRVGRSSRRWK